MSSNNLLSRVSIKIFISIYLTILRYDESWIEFFFNKKEIFRFFVLLLNPIQQINLKISLPNFLFSFNFKLNYVVVVLI
jgi:hypothetical protein